ncbi:D-alanyl-D-alanine dipeptidase [Algoriphagus iocasae]|jgi:zinc D-Ala-D-Ala dipeptidase|uniref:D-alanyl-D-alanine dipeptidase n=1 Tax=Algoriphagus iocasae TaxID=1836499 RepID=A0A841MWW3_9BACT|nr:M15 family metallopeptidase [Algoriphagus iocasae]MBB6327098.1 D-alanyl-D-alanine dipeptidase [Algoriphagus iocasae]
MINSKSILSICLGLAIGFSCSQKEVGAIESELEREIADQLAPSKPTISSSEIPLLEKRLISQGLVNVEEVVPDIRVELKYSTEDNFFGKDVYGELIHAYLQPVVADSLKSAQEMLQNEFPDYTLLIYDGARPLSVQQILWDNLEKPDSLKPLYVADPKVGSLHNFGVAVDLTIFNNATSEPLDMGTGYDFFGYQAYPDREEQMLNEGKLTSDQIANRDLLRKVMTSNGFTGIGSEWWHFNAYSRKQAGELFKIIE